MTNKSLSKREKLEHQIAQKKAQLQKLEAVERTKERKRQTRRKFVAGEVVLNHASANSEFDHFLRRLIDEKITQERDRALFDLSLSQPD